MIFCFETQTKNELATYCKKVYLIVNKYIIGGPHIYFLQVSKKTEKYQMYQKFLFTAVILKQHCFSQKVWIWIRCQIKNKKTIWGYWGNLKELVFDLNIMDPRTLSMVNICFIFTRCTMCNLRGVRFLPSDYMLQTCSLNK